MARERMSSTGARWIAIAAVAVVALGAGALSYAALERAKPEASSASPAPAPTFTLGVDASPSPSPSTPSPAPDDAEEPAEVSEPSDPAAERFFAASSSTWWRATAGSCEAGGAVLERSSDAGVSWTDVTPNYREVSRIAGLSTLAGTEAGIIAQVGADCEVQALRTFTQGQFWDSYPDVLANSRYVDPANPASVVLPTGAVAAPCDRAWGLRSSGTTTAFVCDGVAYTNAGVADGWSPLPSGEVAAVTVDDLGVVLAAVEQSCDGLALTRFAEAAAEPVSLGCADAPRDGPTALAMVDGVPTVWAGDALVAGS